jgi:hypothetical protein
MCVVRAAAAHQHKIKKMEKKMAAFMHEASNKLDGSGFDLKAVFVTFNTESQAEACRAACPHRKHPVCAPRLCAPQTFVHLARLA